VVNRYVGNLAPMPGVFPDYKAPIIRTAADCRELATARWGMPSSGHALMEATKKRESRCVVPFNSFSEFNKAEGGDIWFALDETRPLACFAGIWTNWTSVRNVKEGETNNDLYAFLTTEPNAEVGAIHPKAMPVILTTPEEVETWMTAPPDEALKLQRRRTVGCGSSPAASRKIPRDRRRDVEDDCGQGLAVIPDRRSLPSQA
jgi:putative SOS response-associated peptidase YedK